MQIRFTRALRELAPGRQWVFAVTTQITVTDEEAALLELFKAPAFGDLFEELEAKMQTPATVVPRPLPKLWDFFNGSCTFEFINATEAIRFQQACERLCDATLDYLKTARDFAGETTHNLSLTDR